MQAAHRGWQETLKRENTPQLIDEQMLKELESGCRELSPQETGQLCRLDVYMCCDFLAIATLIGHPGQAGCSCIWCRANAAGYKKIAADHTIAHSLRTPGTEATDLAAFLAQVHQSNKDNVNGVSKPPLFPVTDFLKIMPPVLHVFLGLVNFIIQRIRKVHDYFINDS
jgi:hypothetical protein